MELINKYFTSLTAEQIIKFKQLESLYNDWNSKINVISRKDIDDLYLKHVLHSLAIAKVISFKDGTNILDVGTGGGFPGIPLAILFPNCNFLLLDSIAKKINVVNSVVKSLELNNITTIVSRVESINSKYDFIVSRAVTRMDKFRRLIKDKILKGGNNSLSNGVFYFKGGDISEEMMNIKHTIFNISEFYDEDFFSTKKIVYLKD
jgi:16S rRNA (guanine527-N7)-methyltransferase